MKTDSQKSFIKVKLWFSKLLDQSAAKQKQTLEQLQQEGHLDETQMKLLKQMLQADAATAMATRIESVSETVVNQVGQDNPALEQQQIGPYQIIKPLGEGGMGHVYLAQRNDGTFEQQVALKLPHFNFNPSMKQRFENERQILAQLTHENIARLLDGGTTENNQPYLVMEYINGQTIDDYCVKQIPDLSKRINLILQICQAVTFSHQQLILHRDLKPSNILVTENGQVKLLDFGIAKLLDLDDEAKAKNTATQIMTRYYASPEQLKGKAASTHSDLFSLAIIAYELITGFHPFQHKDQHEREQNLISGKIMRVTQRTEIGESIYPELATIPSGKIQGDLENILLKALSVDPDKRYESVKDFANDLLNFIENRPVSARKQSKYYSFRKLVTRNKLSTFAITFAILSLFLGTGVAIWKANQANMEAQKAKFVAAFLQNIFTKASPMSGKKEVTAKDLLDQGMLNIENDLSDKPKIRFELLEKIIRSYWSLAKYDEVVKMADDNYSLCIQQTSVTYRPCQRLLILASEADGNARRPKKALVHLLKAEKIARNNSPLDYQILGEILNYKLTLFLNLDRFSDAFDAGKEGIEMLRKAGDLTDDILLGGFGDLLIVKSIQEDYTTAKVYLEKGLEVINNGEHDFLKAEATFYAAIRFYYAAQNNYQQAVKYQQKIINIMRQHFSQPGRLFVKRLLNLAQLKYQLGHTESAIKEAKESIEMAQSVNGHLYYTQATSNLMLTMAFIDLKDNLQAKIYLKQAEPLVKKYDSLNHNKCRFLIYQAYFAVIGNDQETDTRMLALKPCMDKAQKGKMWKKLQATELLLKALINDKNGDQKSAIISINNAKDIFKTSPLFEPNFHQLVIDFEKKIL